MAYVIGGFMGFTAAWLMVVWLSGTNARFGHCIICGKGHEHD